MFFTRHFYRALLQRIFLDHADEAHPTPSPAIVIGSLRKPCYKSFTTYVRGAISKIAQAGTHAKLVNNMQDLTDEAITRYEAQYLPKRKELGIMWSLMAFSADVVESVMVVDRWLYLREQAEVKECWVESAFDYRYSPRNLVVVGIK